MKLDDFYLSSNRDAGPVLSVIITAATFLTGLALIVLDWRTDKERFFDVMGYLLPIIAAIIVGITAATKKQEAFFYKMSCFLLLLGVGSFAQTKHILPMVAAAFFGAALCWIVAVLVSDLFAQPRKPKCTTIILVTLYLLMAIAVTGGLSLWAIVATPSHHPEEGAKEATTMSTNSPAMKAIVR